MSLRLPGRDCNWQRYFLTLMTYLSLVACHSKNSPAVTSTNKFIQIALDTIQVNELLHRAIAFGQTNSDSMHYYSIQALQLAKAGSYANGIARATSLLASCNRSTGNFSEAVSLYLAAINMFDSLRLIRERVDAQLSLANVYKEMGGEKGTTGYLHKGLLLARQSQYEASSNNYIPGVVTGLGMQGIILRDMWKIDPGSHFMDTAFAKYEEALQLIGQTGEGKEQLGKLYNNISQVYNERDKNYTMALAYLSKAIDFNTERKNLNSLSFNYGNMSDVYLRMGNKEQANEYAIKMLHICNQLKAPHRILNAYLALYRLNKKLNRYDSALHYHELLSVISDSLTNVQKGGLITEMQTKYETAKKELEIIRLNKTDKINKQRIVVAVSSAIVLLLLLGVSIWLYRRSQVQKIQIGEQSKRLQWMMKELHHRVKNNLQIVSSLLNLQSYRLTDSESITALKESQLRVQAMSLIHQRLYQSADVSLVNFKLYISDLVETLMNAYGYRVDDFDLDLKIGKELLDVDTVLPMGLMVNEIITNSFKYAFSKDKRPLLRVWLDDDGKQLQLEVADNGPGVTVINNQYKSAGFGKSLIDALTKQIKGTYTVSGTGGTSYNFYIPYTKRPAA